MSNNKTYQSEEGQRSPNQNNLMSEDPGDGDRESFVTGKDGKSPVEKAPPNDDQDEDMIETFGEEGAGIAAKE
jgi:hypothetical protein